MYAIRSYYAFEVKNETVEKSTRITNLTAVIGNCEYKVTHTFKNDSIPDGLVIVDSGEFRTPINVLHKLLIASNLAVTNGHVISSWPETKDPASIYRTKRVNLPDTRVSNRRGW